MSNVLPFRGRKAPPMANTTNHPLPWTYEKGFIWDAQGRVVGSTVQPDTAEWVVRCVNSSLEPDPEPEPEPEIISAAD